MALAPQHQVNDAVQWVHPEDHDLGVMVAGEVEPGHREADDAAAT
jgi:hypothetical protein